MHYFTYYNYFKAKNNKNQRIDLSLRVFAFINLILGGMHKKGKSGFILWGTFKLFVTRF